MKILLTGCAGQLGSVLAQRLMPLGDVCAMDRGRLDLLDTTAIRSVLGNERPDVIVNAAAYTAVDQAEHEPEVAFAVNAEAPRILAEEARELDALLVHFSTDYVFDGEKPGHYAETDFPNPLNAYGSSKLAGEQAIAAAGCRYLTLRTSWIYGPGGRNFVRSILSAAKVRPELRVVDDQCGAPTSSIDVAEALARILALSDLRQRPGGVYHLSAAGETTWFGFAQEIVSVAGIAVSLEPVSTAEYGAPARRPTNSVLDNRKFLGEFGFRIGDWRERYRAIANAMH